MDEQREVRFPVNALSIANTKSNDHFTLECKKHGIIPHPARMPSKLVDFFIEFLTSEGDLVVDPFAGSNTTGYCAEMLKRKWLSVDTEIKYGEQSKLRFSETALRANLQTEKGGANLWI